MFALVLIAVQAAPGLSAPALAPAADPRCGLLGVWTDGRCRCDPGWAGRGCATARIKPLDLTLGYHNTTEASWGGRAVEDPGSGGWSMFVSQFSNRLVCPSQTPLPRTNPTETEPRLSH